MTIKQNILTWNGKSVEVLETLYQCHQGQIDFIPEVLSLLANPVYQQAASWLLKQHLSTLGSLDRGQTRQLIGLLAGLEHWQAKLHILQCLAFINVEKPARKKVERFLRTCLEDDNKFVRAWAYSGFYELSRVYPEYRDETKAFFEMAMRDEAVSVKARIRNILKNNPFMEKP